MDRQALLADISQRIDLEAYLRDVLNIQNIQEKGDELHHSCPLPSGNHRNGDLDPSSATNKEKLLFNCFVCQTGGDLYWLTQQVLDLSLGQSIERVAEYCVDGDISTFLEFRQKLIKENGSMYLGRKDWIEYDPSILNKWKRYSRYLEERGVSMEIQIEMETGVEPSYGEWKEERIIIPHFFKHKLLGWTMRRGENNFHKPASPKYIHSMHFPKSDTVYNYDRAIKNANPIIVVESPMSVLSMLSRGYENVVATFGAQVPLTQCDVLREFGSVIIAMDDDHAGHTSTIHLVEELNPYIDVQVCRPATGNDPAEIEDLESWLKKTMPATVWMLQEGSKPYVPLEDRAVAWTKSEEDEISDFIYLLGQ